MEKEADLVSNDWGHAMMRHVAFRNFFWILIIYTNLSAQTWHWQSDDLVLNPSGVHLQNADSWAWGDLDLDGYDDILVRHSRYWGDGRLVAYRGGQPVEPPYWREAPELLSGFVEPTNSFGISLADLDGNGALDMVTHARNQSDGSSQFLCWKKEVTGNWSPDTTIFQNVKIMDYLREADDPAFVDCDGDGDLDMLVGFQPGFGGVGIRYFENIGTPTSPIWQEDNAPLAEVYHNPPGYQTWSATLMHADADNLLDLIVSYDVEGQYDVAYYPGTRDSLGVKWSGDFAYLSLNNDGGFIGKLLTLDIEQKERPSLLALEGGTARLYRPSHAAEATFDNNYFRIGTFQFYAMSSFIPFDLGDDTTLDPLAIGHFYGFFGHYTAAQSYQLDSLAGMRLWRDTHWFDLPTTYADVMDYKAQLVDVNDNSLVDFVGVAWPYSFTVHENPHPTMLRDGWIQRNNLLPPFTGFRSRRDTTYSDPSFADLDGDGDLDLLIAKVFPSGHINYGFFENHLLADSILWLKREDWESRLDGISGAHANFADLDRDNDFDVVFGTHEGGLIVYENIGSSTAPAWRLLPEVFAGIDVGDDANPSFGDFDKDGRVDLFVGNVTGELFFFRNLSTVAVAEPSTEALASFNLWQNYPNPFNAGTVIVYEIPHASHVRLTIYDLLGREVSTLIDKSQNGGSHRVVWKGDGMASGVYVYELRIGNRLHRKKAILLR